MKIVIISGTPGTGKTAVSKELSRKIKAKVISLNDLVIQKDLFVKFDSNRETFVINEDNLIAYVLKLIESYASEKIDFVLIEGHFSDIIPSDFIDYAIVLRCHPDVLLRRLKKKGYNERKIIENIQSEILGNCVNYFLNKNIEIPLLEIDTTNITTKSLARIMIEIITEEKNIDQYQIGRIDWLENLFQQNRLNEFFD
ncbi:MAG: adenylate kinase family protein [Candidatus Odinarchaeota archaeon]